MYVLVETRNRIDAAQLHGELVAAGVRMEPMAPGTILFMRDDEWFTAVVPDGTDEQLVRRVVTSHVPANEPTAAQIKRRQARKLIESDDTAESVRLRAVIRVLYGSLVELRTWCNQMRQQLQAAGMPTPPKLTNRTWEEAMQAVLAQINAEVLDEQFGGGK